MYGIGSPRAPPLVVHIGGPAPVRRLEIPDSEFLLEEAAVETEVARQGKRFFHLVELILLYFRERNKIIRKADVDLEDAPAVQIGDL